MAREASGQAGQRLGLPPQVEEHAAALCGRSQRLEPLSGLSNATVVRYHGDRDVLVVKRTNSRESWFYRDIRALLLEHGIRTPECRFNLVAGEEAWLGLESIAAPFPIAAFPGDASLLHRLALLHVFPLRSAASHLVIPWTRELNHLVAGLFGARRDVVEGLLQRYRSILQCPDCLVWGDANPHNWAMADDSSPVLLDWQRWGIGSRAFDLATFTPGLADRAAARWVAEEYRAACASASLEVPPLELLAGDILRAKAWSVVELLAQPCEPDSALAAEQRALQPLFGDWLAACA